MREAVMARANARAVLTGDITLKGGQEAMWAAMLRLMQVQGSFTFAALRDTTPGAQSWDMSQLRRFLRVLERGGWIEVDRPAPRSASHYRLKRLSARAPHLDEAGRPRPEPVNDVLWRTMKILKTFTQAELHAAASTPERPLTLSSTGAYCSHLARAGVLRELGRIGKRPGARRGFMTYAVMHPHGLAPRILRGHSVYLPGENRIVGGVTLEDAEA